METNILIVDDEAMIRELLSTVLGKEGYTCYQADNAVTAARILAERSIDLALLDIMMPGRTGIQLLQELKKISPGTTALMVTGFSSRESALCCVQEGAKDVITKPFNIHRIVDAVKSVLPT